MKYLFQLILFCSVSGLLNAQPLLKDFNSNAGKGNTYAVIIGISSYLDTDIKALQYSNRDAQVFADFLMSTSGGSVPKQNIKLLIDAAATTGEVDKAIIWLKDNCTADDKVFFYFSGHGELENETMFKEGYLICYNTPSSAFVRMGLSIDRLNKMASTMSNKKANVVIITDACHSGRLSSSAIKGNMLLGEQLMNANEKEIRMASCKPEQLSIEKADWGGGRGVFSYHLINGLQGGLADKDLDGIITTGEIKNYIEYKMANDSVLKRDNEIQTPIVKGRSDFQLSTVVTADAIQIKKIIQEDSMTNVILSVSMANEETNTEPEYYFSDLLKKENLEALTDSLQLNTLPVDSIAFTIINWLKKTNISAAGINKLNELEAMLKTDREKLHRFNVDLSRAFNDKGQNVILQYLSGDEAELERRRYYNSNNNGYDVYIRMFEVAFKLSSSDTYLSTTSSILLHYFRGLALRLKIPLTENPGPLIEQALAEQKKALALHEYAAYIYNELGNLYKFKNDYAEAEKNYSKASQLSPRWAIPQSNLSGLYINQEVYEKAMSFTDIADSLQANLQSTSINRGYIYEKKGNLLLAEEYYYNAIEINSRHFLPFERLGYVNMNTANYAMADSFFYEADLRKKGFHFKGNDWGKGFYVDEYSPAIYFRCNIDSAKLNPKDIFAFFTWGVQEYEAKNYANAVRILKKVIAFDKTNPLVFHYMGKIYYDQQKWEEAEIMFKLAIQYSKGFDDFKKYVDSVKKAYKYPYDHLCFEDFFYKKYYRQLEDYYFAGTVYERWSHWQEAEMYFNKIISLDPNSVQGYVKLWQLLERQGRFNETEEVIKNYGKANKSNKETAEYELNAFYRRTIEKFPEDGNLIYRLGTLLYSRAFLNSIVPYFDTIVRFPLLNKELFIDFDIYGKISIEDSLTLYDKSETGAFDKITLQPIIKGTGSGYIIPGTKDTIPQADFIYMPRKDGIIYLNRAAEIISEKEAQADINFKIGNIFLFAGSKKQAYPYLEKSLVFDPGNANTRLILIDTYKALFINSAALKQLNYLYDSSQINFEKRLSLAQFDIRAGQFDKANELLNKAEYIYPYVLPEIANLRGLSNMLAGKPTEAITFYKKNIDVRKRDPWFTNYSMARLCAITGNTTEAWKYLQYAIDFGFNFSFVLQNDSFMNNIRNTPKWQTMISGISMKKYKKNKPVN